MRYSNYMLVAIALMCANGCSHSRITKSGAPHAIYIQDKSAGYKQALVLSRYRGTAMIPIDTAFFDSNRVTAFMGAAHLADGMYHVGSPLDQQGGVDFLLSSNQTQQFGIRYDSWDQHNTVRFIRFKGSAENTAFLRYRKLLDLRDRATSGAEDSIKSGVKDIDRLLGKEESNMLQQFPNTSLALYINLTAPTTQCDNTDGNSKDSTRADEIAQRFWDQIPLNDERLTTLPPFEEKLAKYFIYLVPRNQLTQAVDSFMQHTNEESEGKRNTALASFCVDFLYELFMTSPYEAYNNAAGHIAEKYILNQGGENSTDPLQQLMVSLELKRIKMNRIGDTVANLSLYNTSGENSTLSTIITRPTLIYFYDPDCGACKASLPLLKQLYASNPERFQIVTISIGSIKGIDQLPEEWINLAADVEDVNNSFNLIALPSVYLIGADRRVVAKNITMEELND